MNETFEHKKTGWKIEFKALTQGDVDDYFAAYKQLAPKDEKSGELHGSALRAAVQSGWIVEPKLTVDLVRTLEPAKVRWMAEKVNQVYLAVTRVPPE